MSNKQLAHESDDTQEVDGGRQRELRALLVSAADAARQSRRAQRVTDRAGRPNWASHS